MMCLVDYHVLGIYIGDVKSFRRHKGYFYTLTTCSTYRFRIHINIYYERIYINDFYKFGKRFPFPLPINERRLKICIFRRSTFCR